MLSCWDLTTTPAGQAFASCYCRTTHLQACCTWHDSSQNSGTVCKHSSTETQTPSPYDIKLAACTGLPPSKKPGALLRHDLQDKADKAACYPRDETSQTHARFIPCQAWTASLEKQLEVADTPTTATQPLWGGAVLNEYCKRLRAAPLTCMGLTAPAQIR